MNYYEWYIAIGLVTYYWILYIGIRDEADWSRVDDIADFFAQIIVILFVICLYPFLLLVLLIRYKANKDKDR